MRWFFRRWWVRAAAVFIALLIAYNLVAAEMARRSQSNLPRSLDTGVIEGLDSAWLGPEDSDRAILLVHGYVGSLKDFGALPDRLAEEGWRVRLLRLPGHGTRPRDLIGVTADDQINAVREELKDLKEAYDFVAIGGFSMGGALSTIAASKESPGALVIAAPYFAVTHRWYYVLRPEWWARIATPFVRWTYKGKVFIQVNRTEARDEIFIYEWMHADAVNMLLDIKTAANDPETLAGITCPVYWVHSPGDVAAAYTAAERAYDAMPAKTKEHLATTQSNHHVFWDYDREEAIGGIVEFLAREGEAGKNL